MILELVTFDSSVLDKSFGWLNDPEVKFLTNSPSISKEQQLEWFDSLPFKKNYFLKGISADKVIIGVIGLKNISTEGKRAEYFGYIGDKNYWGKGIGNWMMDAAIDLAKTKKIELIYLNVIFQNIIAINLYFKKGFRIVHCLEDSYEMQLAIKR